MHEFKYLSAFWVFHSCDPIHSKAPYFALHSTPFSTPFDLTQTYTEQLLYDIIPKDVAVMEIDHDLNFMEHPQKRPAATPCRSVCTLTHSLGIVSLCRENWAVVWPTAVGGEGAPEEKI